MPIRSFPPEIVSIPGKFCKLTDITIFEGHPLFLTAHAHATSQYVNTLAKIFILQATIRVNNSAKLRKKTRGSAAEE